jgi:hypothetical protein
MRIVFMLVSIDAALMLAGSDRYRRLRMPGLSGARRAPDACLPDAPVPAADAA